MTTAANRGTRALLGLAVTLLLAILLAPLLALTMAYPSAAKADSLGTVVIDAGHQASPDYRLEPVGPGSSVTKPCVESGTSGVVTHAPESQVNLDVALKLRDTLQARGVTVVMIRTTQNVDIPNSERAKIANANHAALFIRLHCDGVTSSSVNGLLMLRPGQTQWTGAIVEPSRIAAGYVGRSVLTATGAYNRGTVTRTDLSGFNWSQVPAILVEMGVMSNATEDRKLSTPSYQQTLANGMATGIVGYLNSVHRVGAVIDSETPTSTVAQPANFHGIGGCTLNHGITGFQWRWGGGVLSNEASLTVSTLPAGVNSIYFKAACTDGKWSPEVMTTTVVGDTGTVPRAVYRFRNLIKSGLYFYTADEGEKRSVVAKMGSAYALEGVAYALDSLSATNTAPLYRFYNPKAGTYFYTANETERADVMATLVASRVLNYEGIAYRVATAGAGTLPVWRFYNFKNGTHLYTANEAERAAIDANMKSTYRLEGVAWHYAPPWPVAP